MHLHRLKMCAIKYDNGARVHLCVCACLCARACVCMCACRTWANYHPITTGWHSFPVTSAVYVFDRHAEVSSWKCASLHTNLFQSILGWCIHMYVSKWVLDNTAVLDNTTDTRCQAKMWTIKTKKSSNPNPLLLQKKVISISFLLLLFAVSFVLLIVINIT